MTLTHLIERCESGSGPDREIDCLVGAAADIQVDGVSASWKALVSQFGIEWAVEVANDYHSIWRTELPRYTASLDSVISLIEQKLPGYGHCYATGWDDEGNCGGWVSPERTVDLTKATLGVAKSPARALLAAFLKAYANKEGGHDL